MKTSDQRLAEQAKVLREYGRVHQAPRRLMFLAGKVLVATGSMLKAVRFVRRNIRKV